MNVFDNFKFNYGDVCCVACSAGPDSMALVDMLLKKKKLFNLKIIILHVNHNIRKESIDEEEYLKKYCKNNDIVFEFLKIKEYNDDNFHNEARNIRYRFFDEIVRKYNANYLFTAHHGDDLIETILMRIVRGSNLKGYSGFKKIVNMNDYKIIRPLIEISKDEILEYNNINNIKYFIDSSNDKDYYTRNRYRKNILPFLKKEDNLVHLKFLKFSNVLNDTFNFINKEIDKIVKDIYIDNKLDLSKYLKLDRFLQREILYNIILNYYNDDLFLINDKHIELIYSLIISNKSNGCIYLPNNIIGIKEYNYFRLDYGELSFNDYKYLLSDEVMLPNSYIIKKINKCSCYDNNHIYLNSREVKLPLYVRNRKNGDKIQIKGLNGSKKVKDIFIDSKIKIKDRNIWPIVLDSNDEIVWIPGIKKSKFDKSKTDNYDIILEYIFKEEKNE